MITLHVLTLFSRYRSDESICLYFKDNECIGALNISSCNYTDNEDGAYYSTTDNKESTWMNNFI